MEAAAHMMLSLQGSSDGSAPASTSLSNDIQSLAREIQRSIDLRLEGKRCASLRDSLFHLRKDKRSKVSDSLQKKMRLLNDCVSVLKHFNQAWKKEILEEVQDVLSSGVGASNDNFLSDSLNSAGMNTSFAGLSSDVKDVRVAEDAGVVHVGRASWFDIGDDDNLSVAEDCFCPTVSPIEMMHVDGVPGAAPVSVDKCVGSDMLLLPLNKKDSADKRTQTKITWSKDLQTPQDVFDAFGLDIDIVSWTNEYITGIKDAHALNATLQSKYDTLKELYANVLKEKRPRAV
eukprot:TRINITY_DN28089_c0_g1_i3.p1 TRINITY_DN28089_c0_g1~~TRINITY_DN28089_c0_g1_i3.p1  ORF type:complete len:331 (+),score=75.18 TRINITY_DN28089_c0_g1_i3:131-994(+)